jgi:RimJ/RimL family protein N-acetyltransferase
VPVTLQDLDWPRHTERLTLRPATANDAAATWAFWQRADVVEWLPAAPADLGAHTERFSAPHRLESTIVVEREGSIVGQLTLAVRDGWVQDEVASAGARIEAELGYVLHPDVQGLGLAREAVRAALDLGFGDLGLRRITASLFAANVASVRLLEAFGFRCEQRSVRDGLHRELGWLDGRTYALLAEEWRGSEGPA